MPKRTTDYRRSLLEELKNPTEAAHYLNAALRDSEEMFLVALRDVAEARQMAKVAENAGVSRESLYRMLSPSGNPTYRSLISILRALDIEFTRVRSRSVQTESGVRLPEKRSIKHRQHLTRRRGVPGASQVNIQQYAAQGRTG